MPLAVTLYSLLINLAPGTEIHVYVLSLGIRPETKARIRRTTLMTGAKVTLDFVDVDPQWLKSLPESRHITSAAYLRIFIPQLIPDVDKILYLDSDLLVRKDIRPLWNHAVEDYHLLAARDPWIPTVSSTDGPYNWEDLGIHKDAPYFNSGVLLLNLKKWRESDLSETLVNYVRDHRENIILHDQEALNAVCHNSWGMLDMTWNVIPLPLPDFRNWQPTSLRDYVQKHFDDLWHRPSICHFGSQWKPWSHGFRVPFQADWFRTLKRSGWFSPSEYQRWILEWNARHVSSAIRRKVLAGHAL